jgi:hypothetical protein
VAGVEIDPSQGVTSGDRVEMTIHVAHPSGSLGERVAVWFHVRSLKTGEIVFASSTHTLGLSVPDRGDFRVRASMQLNVPAGSYAMECHVWDQIVMKEIDIGPPHILQVREGSAFMGSVQMNPTVTVDAAD